MGMNIDSICKKYDITNYTINLDGSIDVKGSVNLYDKNLTKLPLKFGKITRHFDCSNNQLTNLEGSPTSVGGHFSCINNQLISLEGSPISVGGHFSCHNNQLTNLKGSPKYVGGHFSCHNNQLTDYTEILNIDIKGRIIIDGKNYITKQEILIISLNNLLEPYDLVIDNDYIIKDVFDNIVIRSNNKNLKNDVMELL